jgi:quercetin dioxygenase-like cupin family protein
MTHFRHISSLNVLPIWEQVTARVVEGREITMALVELAPHAVVAEHQHPNEQMGMVLSGALRFTVDGESKDLQVGDTYSIPGGVLHDVVAGPDGAVAMDIFAPIRSDWARFRAEPPKPCRWPSSAA